MVVLAGAELLQEHTHTLRVLEKKGRVTAMLRNWVIVYAGNLGGSALIAWLMNQTGLFSSGGDMLGRNDGKNRGRQNIPCFRQGVYTGYAVQLACMPCGVDILWRRQHNREDFRNCFSDYAVCNLRL